jgi:hypothetical protein
MFSELFKEVMKSFSASEAGNDPGAVGQVIVNDVSICQTLIGWHHSLVHYRDGRTHTRMNSAKIVKCVGCSRVHDDRDRFVHGIQSDSRGVYGSTRMGSIGGFQKI